MPCYTDPPSHHEEEERRLNLLLDEIGDTADRQHGGNIYGKMRKLTLDECTQRLCAFCNSHDVKKYSLELQIWWRDHQIADARHKEEQKKLAKKAALRRSACSKLTPEELQALLEGR